MVLAAVVRVFPPTRVRDVANVVAALSGTGFYVGWLILRSQSSGQGRSLAGKQRHAKGCVAEQHAPRSRMMGPEVRRGEDRSRDDFR